MGGSSTIPTSCSAISQGYRCGNPGAYGTIGVPAPTNAPGSREAGATWTDSQGNLWIFGGFGVDSAGTLGDLNDLWEFNISNPKFQRLAGSILLICKEMGRNSVSSYWERSEQLVCL
jgi:hypothetical protein